MERNRLSIRLRKELQLLTPRLREEPRLLILPLRKELTDPLVLLSPLSNLWLREESLTILDKHHKTMFRCQT